MLGFWIRWNHASPDCRLLLLFALVGNFGPCGAGVSAAPSPHACCVRKAPQAHPCHGMAMATIEPQQLAVRSTGCCNHDCCRGVTVGALGSG